MDDCNHIVEVHAMDHLMKQNEESGENEIKVLVCCWLISIKLNGRQLVEFVIHVLCTRSPPAKEKHFQSHREGEVELRLGLRLQGALENVTQYKIIVFF